MSTVPNIEERMNEVNNDLFQRNVGIRRHEFSLLENIVLSRINNKTDTLRACYNALVAMPEVEGEPSDIIVLLQHYVDIASKVEALLSGFNPVLINQDAPIVEGSLHLRFNYLRSQIATMADNPHLTNEQYEEIANRLARQNLMMLQGPREDNITSIGRNITEGWADVRASVRRDFAYTPVVEPVVEAVADTSSVEIIPISEALANETDDGDEINQITVTEINMGDAPGRGQTTTTQHHDGSVVAVDGTPPIATEIDMSVYRDPATNMVVSEARQEMARQHEESNMSAVRAERAEELHPEHNHLAEGQTLGDLLRALPESLTRVVRTPTPPYLGTETLSEVLERARQTTGETSNEPVHQLGTEQYPIADSESDNDEDGMMQTHSDS